LRKRAHAFWRMSMSFWYSSIGLSLGSNTTTQDCSTSIESKIQEKLLIHIYIWNVGYTYYQIEGIEKRVEGLTWSCTATEWIYKYSTHPRPWIYCSRSDFANWVHYSRL
jgi:hypothetical protein